MGHNIIRNEFILSKHSGETFPKYSEIDLRLKNLGKQRDCLHSSESELC
jgi:hypothetical protein